jgi:hypothetical protein
LDHALDHSRDLVVDQENTLRAGQNPDVTPSRGSLEHVDLTLNGDDLHFDGLRPGWSGLGGKGIDHDERQHEEGQNLEERNGVERWEFHGRTGGVRRAWVR